MNSPDLIVLSIAIGIVVSFLFSEVYGLAAGGVVVPGYVAMYLDRPWAVVLTLTISLATFAVVRAMSSFLIIYGRRRTSLAILVGFAMGAWVARLSIFPQDLGVEATDITVIGFIIPGLIAIWFDRQGVAPTVASLLIAAVIVRATLLILVGPQAVGL